MAATSADLSRFTACMRQLAQFSGKDMREVMTAEAGKCLEIAVRYTPKADREKIREQITANTKWNFEHQHSDSGQISTTKDGKQWFRPGREHTWLLIEKWRVSNKVWREYLSVKASFLEDYRKTLARRLREALARRGLTANTWTQIARAIKANIKVPAFVEKAKTPDGIGTGYVTADSSECTVVGENASEVLINTRTGQGIIDRAIRSRTKFAEIAIAKGALDSLKARARAFPEIFKP